MTPDSLAQGGLVLPSLEDTQLPSPCLPHLGKGQGKGQGSLLSRTSQQAARVTKLIGAMAGAAS